MLKAVDSSLSPDNIDFPRGMKFSQEREPKNQELNISVSYDEFEDTKKLETLISTLDEILAHIYSATGTVEEAEKA